MPGLDGLPIVLMLTTLALVWTKKIVNAIKILALQSLVLSFIALSMAWQTGITNLYIMAAMTLVVKAILIPWILYFTMQKVGIERETEKLVGREVSLLIALGMVWMSYFVTRDLPLPADLVGHPYLPVSIAILMIGLFVMVTHQKAVMQGVGLVVMENGLFLVALSTTYGMPLLVDLGGFLDVFVAVILISMLTYRINRTYQSIHTDQLRKLRG